MYSIQCALLMPSMSHLLQATYVSALLVLPSMSVWYLHCGFFWLSHELIKAHIVLNCLI